MRSLGWALIQTDHCPHGKDKFGYRDTHIETMPREDESRDEGDASTSQETPKIVSKALGVRRKAWERFSLTALRRSKLCPHLDLGLLVAVNEKCCLPYQ